MKTSYYLKFATIYRFVTNIIFIILIWIFLYVPIECINDVCESYTKRRDLVNSNGHYLLILLIISSISIILFPPFWYFVKYKIATKDDVKTDRDIELLVQLADYRSIAELSEFGFKISDLKIDAQRVENQDLLLVFNMCYETIETKNTLIFNCNCLFCFFSSSQSSKHKKTIAATIPTLKQLLERMIKQDSIYSTHILLHTLGRLNRYCDSDDKDDLNQLLLQNLSNEQCYEMLTLIICDHDINLDKEIESWFMQRSWMLSKACLSNQIKHGETMMQLYRKLQSKFNFQATPELFGLLISLGDKHNLQTLLIENYRAFKVHSPRTSLLNSPKFSGIRAFTADTGTTISMLPSLRSSSSDEKNFKIKHKMAIVIDEKFIPISFNNVMNILSDTYNSGKYKAEEVINDDDENKTDIIDLVGGKYKLPCEVVFELLLESVFINENRFLIADNKNFNCILIILGKIVSNVQHNRYTNKMYDYKYMLNQLFEHISLHLISYGLPRHIRRMHNQFMNKKSGARLKNFFKLDDIADTDLNQILQTNETKLQDLEAIVFAENTISDLLPFSLFRVIVGKISDLFVTNAENSGGAVRNKDLKEKWMLIDNAISSGRVYWHDSNFEHDLEKLEVLKEEIIFPILSDNINGVIDHLVIERIKNDISNVGDIVAHDDYVLNRILILYYMVNGNCGKRENNLNQKWFEEEGLELLFNLITYYNLQWAKNQPPKLTDEQIENTIKFIVTTLCNNDRQIIFRKFAMEIRYGSSNQAIALDNTRVRGPNIIVRANIEPRKHDIYLNNGTFVHLACHYWNVSFIKGLFAVICPHTMSKMIKSNDSKQQLKTKQVKDKTNEAKDNDGNNDDDKLLARLYQIDDNGCNILHYIVTRNMYKAETNEYINYSKEGIFNKQQETMNVLNFVCQFIGDKKLADFWNQRQGNNSLTPFDASIMMAGAQMFENCLSKWHAFESIESNQYRINFYSNPEEIAKLFINKNDFTQHCTDSEQVYTLYCQHRQTVLNFVVAMVKKQRKWKTLKNAINKFVD